MKTKLALLLPLLVLVLAAAACGGSDPVTIEEIGVFPGAVPVKEGNLIAQTLSEAIKKSAGDESLDVVVQTYNVPEGTTWDQVKAFFTDQVRTGDWTLSEDIGQETDYASMIGWTRGSLASEQVLVAAFALDPLGEAPYLIVALFNE